MNLLAIDTSTEMCSVALLCDQDILQRMESQQKHSVVILEMVEAVLAQAGLGLTQLDALAYGRGPGMFTGLRIAAGVTQGLALGAGLPVVPVSSLAILAQGVDADRIMVCMDARMSQLYVACYERDAEGLVHLSPDSEECLSDIGEVSVPGTQAWTGAGSGWQLFAELLKPRCEDRIVSVSEHRHPQARHALPLAQQQFNAGLAVAAEQALPVYLRDKVAKTIIERGADR